MSEVGLHDRASAEEELPFRLSHAAAGVLRRHFLFLLVAAYGLAAVGPGLGRWVGGLGADVGPAHLSVPMVMLAAVLFLAGLEVPTAGLRHLLRKPAPLVVGLLVNLIVPVLFIAGVAQLTRSWAGAGVQPVLVGLGLIAAMPIAGSATAWAQKADGDLGLSLGLVLASTALSLVTTPVTLYAVSVVALGDDAAVLRDLAAHGSGGFLLVCVLVPSAAGIAARRLLGTERVKALHPVLKTVSSVVLLVLVYVNASRSLPHALAQPDPDLLVALTLVAGSFCAVAFASGWLVARLLRVPPGEQASLVFALGMSNNGTGMVLAAAALADRPEIGLVIVCYNLIQQLAAGGVDYVRTNWTTEPGPGGGWFRTGPLRALASFGFVLIAAVVVANASASYWNVRTLADGNRWVVHTHEVISRLQDVLSLLKDAETGQRGYLLTGRDEYLEPYRAAVEKVPGRVEQLQVLTADNPDQQTRLAKMRARIDAKLGELREAVSARREKGQEAALAVVLDGRGKKMMDDLRTVADEMEATELAALEQRAAAADLRVRRTLSAIVLTTLVVLIVHVARGLSQFRRRPATTGGDG
ncbi:CHASE3 domain-containing protein [Limnoglobus roseus]|uniref:CHASE3 domain-containing protein n=1 Tax=Limnoglobus roseus TaxID=2598579 RepID=UPI001C49AF5D|nr:CHASE3 domain-containing protein [Limnoglobus roseus]